MYKISTLDVVSRAYNITNLSLKLNTDEVFLTTDSRIGKRHKLSRTLPINKGDVLYVVFLPEEQWVDISTEWD